MLVVFTGSRGWGERRAESVKSVSTRKHTYCISIDE